MPPLRLGALVLAVLVNLFLDLVRSNLCHAYGGADHGGALLAFGFLGKPQFGSGETRVPDQVTKSIGLP